MLLLERYYIYTIDTFIIDSEHFIIDYLIREMSSIRPPLPLNKLEARIPNLLLAADRRSDRVPYTATT